MTTPKFTPGPWTFKGTLFGEWHIGSEYGVDGNKLPSGRQLVCTSPSASSKLNPEYFEMFLANANLIAAAPELYEALVYARRFLREQDHDTDYVDAALSKARGEG